MNIEQRTNGAEIVLEVEGRIDANTSDVLQNAIINAFQTTNKIVLDFAKVSYIASAGLRALLIGHKTALSKFGYMKIQHVTDTVMNVLEMSGFTNILSIE